MVSVDDVEQKLVSLGYVKEGIYDISFHRLLAIGEEAFCLYVKEHDFSFGVRYTITAQSMMVNEDQFDDTVRLLATAEGRDELSRRIVMTVNNPHPENRKTVKISLNWLEPSCIVSGMDQIEQRLVEAVRTALLSVEECE